MDGPVKNSGFSPDWRNGSPQHMCDMGEQFRSEVPMFMRILAPQRHQPVPVTGTFLSLTAHAAIATAVLAGGGSPLGRDVTSSSPPSEERLHWVGIGEGGGRSVTRPHASTRPPVAYVVPGRGPTRALATREVVRNTPSRDDAMRARRAQGGGSRLPIGHETHLAAGPGTGTRGLGGPDPEAPRRSPVMRQRAAAVPNVVLPTEDAMRLVAGVLSAAPDFARRIARPEDFAPSTAPPLLADLLARTGVTALAMMPADVHVHDLPIPLLGNPRPAYPVALAQAHMGGRVVVEFLIDSSGIVDLGSLHVVQSTDTRFTDAVRSVLPQLRFMPAQFGEHAVGVTVRQPFIFTLRAGL